MNLTLLTGNLGADPESVYTSEGTHIVNFDLAFNSGKDRTSWVKVACFNKLAEIAEKYLHKGAKILLTGALDLNKWKTDDGENRSMLKILANRIEFIKTDGRGFEGGEPPADDVPF